MLLKKKKKQTYQINIKCGVTESLWEEEACNNITLKSHFVVNYRKVEFQQKVD